MESERNGYSVRVGGEGSSWAVTISEPGGAAVFSRACATEVEARTFASAVRQHIEWLSPARFRAYYRIEDPPQR